MALAVLVMGGFVLAVERAVCACVMAVLVIAVSCYLAVNRRPRLPQDAGYLAQRIALRDSRLQIDPVVVV